MRDGRERETERDRERRRDREKDREGRRDGESFFTNAKIKRGANSLRRDH